MDKRKNIQDAIKSKKVPRPVRFRMRAKQLEPKPAAPVTNLVESAPTKAPR